MSMYRLLPMTPSTMPGVTGYRTPRIRWVFAPHRTPAASDMQTGVVA